MEEPWIEEPTIWNRYVEFDGKNESLIRERFKNRFSQARRKYEIFRAGFIAGGCS